MRADAILETRGVTMRFGGVIALENVDFRLENDELRCLIGPNGAGKSTFFKCLTGLLTPSEGSIYLQGEDCTGIHPHAVARRGVGIKTQVPSVMNTLTAHENIWLSARQAQSSREANRTTQEVLERLDLEDIATDEVATLAHGKRQLVELGIVMAGRPSLVLLDEPAAGLTGEEVERMIEVIHELNRDAALVIVEHDMHFVRSIAQTVTVFHQGRVLTEAPVEAVMADPAVRDVYLGKRA